MANLITLATFNCENLFRRTKVLNLRDTQKSTEFLNKISKLQGLVDKATYSETLKQDIFDLSAELKEYIDFRVDTGSFGDWRKNKEKTLTGFLVNQKCTGRSSWHGHMTFKDEAFDDPQRKNTAQVIKDAKADVICLVEVENMKTIQQFNSDLLDPKYKQYIVIDSPNDRRGIDVACLSKFPILKIKTHIFEYFAQNSPMFSRDCLEVSLDIDANKPLHVLCNHFKSQMGKSKEEEDDAAAKRKRQATRVVEILQTTYDLKTDLVAVMGDLNEDSSNAYKSLEPLFTCPDLFPIVDPNKPMIERYTHYYEKGKKGERLTQLDYIFVSKALHQKLKKFGFVREGIFDIDKATTEAGAVFVKPYDEVNAWDLSASDHAALWAQFEV